MNLVQMLKYISTHFSNESRTMPIKNNTFIHQCKENINMALPLSLFPVSFSTSLSFGKGRWARVPWIAIMDTDITESVQYGVSIVFLFTIDGQGVYLTLNQGWRFFKETYANDAKDKISVVTHYFQRSLQPSAQVNDFSCAKIHLDPFQNKPGELGKGYEAGTIFNKFYKIAELTNQDNDAIVRDVLSLSHTYQQLKNSLNESYDFSEKITDILQNNMSTPSKQASKISSTLHEDSTPYLISRSPKEFTSATKKDYTALEERNSKLGQLGEFFVIDYEQKRLAKSPLLKPYINKIKHVSLDRGDGLGYDIQSYDLDTTDPSQTRKINIEVKTTNSKESRTPFFISANEWHYLRQNSESFRLYRVYNYEDHPNLRIFTAEDLLPQITLTPTTYRINFK